VSGRPLAVTLPGIRTGINAATGETVHAPSDLADAAAWLPHSCDEWIIGEGAPDHVITALQALRDEIDAAITRLQADPEESP
jgi:hypothetical protein